MEKRLHSMAPAADLPQLLALYAARQPKEGREGQSWYSIANLSQTEAEIAIYDEIGMWGISASEFIKDLAAVKASTISLRINSPGGDVFDGIAIYNAIARHSATVNVYVDGLAASAASFIAMAGDSVTMMPHSQMMIHEAAGLVIGSASDMQKMADILNKSSDNIASIYAEKAGGTVEDWRALMQAETWFSDQEAVDAGLADKVEGAMMTCPDCGAEMPQGSMVCADCGAQMAALPPKKMPMGNQLDPDPKPEPEPEPEPAPEPEPIDFNKLTQQLSEEAEEAVYAVA